MSASIAVTGEAMAAHNSPIQPYIVFYNRSYHRYASYAFTLTRHAVEVFNVDLAVFATAMVYWHEFAARHGCRKVDAAVLAAACVFLAVKVEHYRVRADQIVKSLFEIDPSTRPEEFRAWRQTLLEVELVLSDALNFDFQRTHCRDQLMGWVGSYGNMPAAQRTAVEADTVKKLEAVAHSMVIFSLITPVYTRASPQQVAATIMSTIALYSGNEEVYAHLQPAYSQVEAADRVGILGVILDGLALSSKETGLERLDEQIRLRRHRLRRGSGSEGLRSTVMNSSSVGSGSHDASPLVRG